MAVETPSGEVQETTVNEPLAPVQVVESGEERTDTGEVPQNQVSESGTETTEQQQTEAAPTPTPTPTERPARLQRRIDTLTRRNYELLDEISQLRRQTQSNEGARSAQPAVTESAPTIVDRPKRENFTDEDEYFTALSTWNTQKVLAEREQKTQADTRKREEEARIGQWTKTLEAAREKYEDFDDIVGSDTPINQGIAQAMIDSPVGGDIAYYLGSHPEVAQKLSQMSVWAGVREIGRIEAQFLKEAQPTKPSAGAVAPSTQQTPTKPTETKPTKQAAVSTAPKPITPVTGRAVADKDPDQMSYQEYKQWREEQIAKRRRR
jgi:hypothetical protein